MIRAALLVVLAGPVWADAVVTTHVVKAGAVIQAEDLSLRAGSSPGALTDPALVAGQEARVVLYPGRPIRAEQIGPPAIVQRNQLVPLLYVSGAIAIATEGRALARGGVGDLLPVLNLSSRTTVQGRVMPDGSVRVGPTEG